MIHHEYILLLYTCTSSNANINEKFNVLNLIDSNTSGSVHLIGQYCIICGCVGWLVIDMNNSTGMVTFNASFQGMCIYIVNHMKQKVISTRNERSVMNTINTYLTSLK